MTLEKFGRLFFAAGTAPNPLQDLTMRTLSEVNSL